MKRVLGIDAGGSKCDAAVIDEAGRVLGWGRGGPTQRWYVEERTAGESMRTAILGALSTVSGSVTRVVACASNFGPKTLRRWGGEQLETAPFQRASEADAGLAAALRTDGLLVLSGTGSFVFGRSPEGTSVKAGGEGPLLADEGSAYQIGVAALRASFRSHHDTARQTSLVGVVLEQMGCRTLRELLRTVYGDGGLSRFRIAALAQWVDHEAETGDRVAGEIIDSAADALSELLFEVVKRLYPAEARIPLVACGSVAQNSRRFWRRIVANAERIASGVQPIQPRVRPVVGACLIGLRSLGVHWENVDPDAIAEGQRAFVDWSGQRRSSAGAVAAERQDDSLPSRPRAQLEGSRS